jgi:hypothetical protein
MKLWFILMIYGSPAVVVGPLPYDMDECRARAAEKVLEAYVKAEAHPEVGIPPHAFTASCRYSETRPEVAEGSIKSF